MKIGRNYVNFISVLVSLLLWGCWGSNLEDFLHCISSNSSNSTLLYTQSSSSYSSVLNFTIRNLRFSGPNVPKPIAIIKPSQPSQVQAAVICCNNHDLRIRVRSGGHDFEGLSYVANVTFVVIDLVNLNSVTVDTENNTAWVQSGATQGEVYYKLGQKTSAFGFPGGVQPTVGIGGFLSGGGYGMMVRRYGLGADNVVDALLVDANGRLLDRDSMGEDLFWAIRGGGGGSFGIVLAWKLKLVPVPPTVTSFAAYRSLDQNATDLVHRWQFVAPVIDERLFIGVIVSAANSMEGGGGRTKGAFFYSLFLGKAEELIPIMEKSFPELGLKKEDCLETNWVESTAYPASGFVTANDLNVLLDRAPLSSGRYKTKSDYITEPISEAALDGIWERLDGDGIETVQLVLIPYGGKMNEIAETELPSPHRAGYPIKIGYYVTWESGEADMRHLEWSREVYEYMAPFVSKSPRAAYVNYRDLDIGTNNEDGTPTSFEEASVWGLKYFGVNFERRMIQGSKNMWMLE
ncbi:Berberine bridge enzyme-like 26, partial [Cucurbita argyrosperma subsp. sororia]